MYPPVRDFNRDRGKNGDGWDTGNPIGDEWSGLGLVLVTSVGGVDPW